MLDLLQGIRVVSFNHFLLGPMGIQALADLGADVIAVETPEGGWQRHWSSGGLWCDGQSMLQLCANRNKRSIALDLKSLKGKEIALKLVDTRGRRRGELPPRRDGEARLRPRDAESAQARPDLRLGLGLRAGRPLCRAARPGPPGAGAVRDDGDHRPGRKRPAAGRGLGDRPPRRGALRTGRARGPRAPRAHRPGLPRRREPDAVRPRPSGRVARGVAQRPRPAEKGERAQARGRLVLRRALWRISDRGRPHRPVADPARRPRRRRRRASAGDVLGGGFLHPAGPDRRPRRGRPQGAHDQPNGRRSSTKGSFGTPRCRTTPRSRRTRR